MNNFSYFQFQFLITCCNHSDQNPKVDPKLSDKLHVVSSAYTMAADKQATSPTFQAAQNCLKKKSLHLNQFEQNPSIGFLCLNAFMAVIISSGVCKFRMNW